MNGYIEADKIGKRISTLLDKEGIKKDNRTEWLRFIKTIKTTLDMLSDEVVKVL